MGTRSLPAVVLLVCLPTICSAAAPKRYAVVIGINDYADPAIPDLKYAESDARAVYETLTDPQIGRFAKENVTLLLGKQATPSEIKAALYKLRGVDKSDLVVVFYSGHGAKEGDEAFWVTQNARRKALPATSLSNSEIRKYLKLIPSRRMVILLDCCYAASTVKKTLADPGRLFGDFAGKGRVTIAGAAEKQEALEYEAREAGVFSYYLVRGLRGAADVNTDGVVTFEEIWEYLGANVRKASVKQGGLHEPKLLSEDGLTPRFLLTFNPKVAAASKAAVKALRKLFAGDKISGAQFDLGRKVLTGPALDALTKARREVFQELVDGRLNPKFLDDVLAAAEKKAGKPAPRRPPPSGKPTLAVVPFEVLGDVRVKDAGRILAEAILPHFAETHTLIDYAQLKRFVDQDRLTMAGLAQALSSGASRTKGLSKAVKLRAVRYLVVGSIAGLTDGSVSVTARISDWQTGSIQGNRVAQIGADGWRTLLRRLPNLAGRLTGRRVPLAAAPPKTLTLDLGGGVTMRLALIPAGKFRMGSGVSAEQLARQYAGAKAEHFADEHPQHEVRITKPFYMGVTEVTQSQWKAVMGTQPWKGQRFAQEGGENAASWISWENATAFCAALSKKARRAVRLPTEAQWEYACRAGTTTKYSFGDDDAKLGDYAWYEENADKADEKYAHAVARKKPNAWGLYDMHGNVWEWCADWYDTEYYSATANGVNPPGPVSGKYRVLRGGCWDYDGRYCRSADRDLDLPVFRTYRISGFRVVVGLASGVD